jgi:single-stranded-DNA-specific exonuclease
MNAAGTPLRPVHRWVLAEPQPEAAAEMAGALGRSPLLAQCLINRGLREPEIIRSFLEPRLAGLADPFDLPDLEIAARRLLLAKERNEAVLVFGDYDVDGITSTAILAGLLGQFHLLHSCYLPHREDEGYGLTEGAVASALAEFPAAVFIAVDCGSASGAIIEALQSRGIDVIVLDHHQPGEPEPKPFSFVNPHRDRTGGGAFRELCSAGLAFKLAHGLVKLARAAGCPEAAACDVRQWLDFAALGIVADLVPVTGENRPLLAAGLRRLNERSRPGLAALLEAAGVKGEIGVSAIGFQIAPRLNAAGRLESAAQALRLLLCEDAEEAAGLASALDEQNRLRRKIERGILDQVLKKARPSFDPGADWVIVEGEAEWHIGVVGIVAARVMREFHRPTVILGGAPPWRGSGRSIAGFDLGAALDECADLLLRHGGHAMAAGVTLDPANLEAFRRRLNDLAKARLSPEDLCPVLRVDAETRLADVSPERIDELRLLEPYGQSHPPIHLLARRVRLKRPTLRMGAEQQHAKLWITDGEATTEAVYWNADAHPLPDPEEAFDFVFVPELNTYRGRTQTQLRLLDWRQNACLTTAAPHNPPP